MRAHIKMCYIKILTYRSFGNTSFEMFLKREKNSNCLKFCYLLVIV